MEIYADGKDYGTSGNSVQGRIIVRGRIVRIAEIRDEEWIAESQLGDPVQIMNNLRATSARVDVFTFTQKLPNSQPMYPFQFEWDNVAAIRTGRFDNWWKSLPQEARKNSRRAMKRGVEVRNFLLDDQAVRNIVEIYNETPVRQGRPFAHFGKPPAVVKGELSSLLDSSEFLGAFHGEELLGFSKLVHMGPVTGILHIVSKNTHYDKRPSNALIVAAAERCRDLGVEFLTYGKFTYGNKLTSPLTEFKRRMGFEKVDMPRYFIPLSIAGRAFTALKLHRGAIGLLPPKVIQFSLSMRSRIVETVWAPRAVGPRPRRISSPAQPVDND